MTLYKCIHAVFHVILSLVGIGSGLVMHYDLLASKHLIGWTELS